MKKLLIGVLITTCLFFVACEESMPWQSGNDQNSTETPSGDTDPGSSTDTFISLPSIRIENHDITVEGKNVVKIESAIEGAEIYYTLDGTNPSISNGSLYAEPGILVDDSVMVKAVMIKDGESSSVSSKSFSKIVFLDFQVRDTTIKINSSYSNIYYVEGSDENDPQDMISYTEEFEPSEKSVFGVSYTVVTGQDGFINAVSKEAAYTAKPPYVLEPYLITGTLYTVVLVSNASYARFTMDGTDPSRSEGVLMSGTKEVSYPAYFRPHPIIKLIGFEAGKLCSEIVRFN